MLHNLVQARRALGQAHRMGLGGFKRRPFSVKAIHSVFPASLTYYCPRRRSSLFAHGENGSRPADIYDEGVVVARDGLVYPGVDTCSVSNGAVMSPNTFTQQEYIRRYFDEFLDRKESGVAVETPSIFTIAKGTSIPGCLILIRDQSSRYSLQPSYGMSLQELNGSLDDFWDRYAIKETVEQWLDSHPFRSAMTDEGD